MTRNYIRGFARSLRRVPLQEAAADLRVLLLYTGAAWGAGGFLVMPAHPLLPVLFVALPAGALAMILRERLAAALFCLPAALVAAGAALQGGAPAMTAGAILAAGLGAPFLSALRHKQA